jgi:uncharacterized alpha-E superfamily protein
MSRYTERAENLARMLQVDTHWALLPREVGELDRSWEATLSMVGQLDTYRERYGEISADQVIRFLAFDEDNPASIVSNLNMARENARAVRGTLTFDQWEIINSTWLELKLRSFDHLQGDALTGFFEWVKLRSHLSRGATIGTMMRDEGFDFKRIGTFLERADNTARILDVQFRGTARIGISLRDLPQGLPRPHHAGTHCRTDDPARRHAALIASLRRRTGAASGSRSQ